MEISEKAIDDHKLFCDFCNHKKPFKKLQQVPLRVDKHAKNQMLFAFQCVDCKGANERVTIGGQQIRVFTGRSRSTDESTVFDEEDSGNNI
jgi:hypothetical protein